MDSGVGTSLELRSYASTHHYQEHILQSPSSGRKRKLQLEQLALPMSKHKSRHQPDLDESSGDNMDESETARAEGASSRGISNTMRDLKDHAEMSPKIFVPRFQSSASAGNPPEGSGFRDRLYSLDSRVVQNSKNSNRQLPALDANHGVDEPDCRLPAPGVDEGEVEFIEEEEEECSYATAQELMLSCCEDVGLHTLGLSSAKWNIKQDALPGSVRPTIDKEFEEYFSMLML